LALINNGLIMSRISENLQAVHARIAVAASKVSRGAQEITLLAVSKTFGPEAVLQAYEFGQRDFGENYLQEALEKIAAVNPVVIGIHWHFIGPVQANKTRPLAENFDWVHSVDREKIARRLAEQRPPHLPPLNVCIQVNLDDENTKSGVEPTEVMKLASVIVSMPSLRLRGLMAIPAPSADFDVQRRSFHALNTLFCRLRDSGIAVDTLSIGMSADLEAAIAEGATIVRVGSAVFGERRYDR
jgi:pyridoxal phosphate enzyme (YggS family)